MRISNLINARGKDFLSNWAEHARGDGGRGCGEAGWLSKLWCAITDLLRSGE